ncbi:MAG: toprim domain-containing protein [Minicystis sp.]
MPPDLAMSIAVVAEKPSVARDLARALGASSRGEGYIHGNGYVVTWAIGHLVALAQPHEIEPEWKRWRLETLPMLPPSWPLVVYPETKAQFDVVSKILRSPKIERVIAATDAGREGELDLPIHLRGGRLLQAGQPTLDLLAHARRHQGWFPAPPRRERLRIRSPTPPAAAAAPTGSWG